MIEKATIKDIQKIAFAIGFGLTTGKYAGKMVTTLYDGGINGFVKVLTKNYDKPNEGISEDLKKDTDESKS